MATWSLSLLVITITYFTYRHPPASWKMPAWLRPARRRVSEAKPARSESHTDHSEMSSVPIITKDMRETLRNVETKSSSPPRAMLAQENSPPGDSTPKAAPALVASGVPSFVLDDEHAGIGDHAEKEDAPSMFPAYKSAQRVSAMPPPPKPQSLPTTKSQSSLMPPPSRKAPMTAAGGLRTPSRGPLPNRGPPASQASLARSSLAPTVNTPNARQKVLLKPGHSPLDWATLAGSSNLAGVPNFQRVTPSVLAQHNGRKGRPAWSSYLGKVYNISPYLPFHPGGEGELLRGAGKDGGKLFMEAHPWVNWENMLNSCLVGIMVSESDGEGLEGLD